MDIVKLECLVDSSRGVYMGQFFAENYADMIEDNETRRILLSGPDDPDYMEAFDDFVTSYSNDRDFLTFGEGAPDLLLATPDVEAETALVDLLEKGNKVMYDLATDTEQWMTKEDILAEIADYPYQTPECKAWCDEIREALQ